VKAKNAVGWSKPSKQELEVVLSPEFVKPDQPGIPEVKKIGNKHVELAWAPPLKDGGSRITGYIVEKKQAGSEFWVRAHHHNVLEPACLVNDLVENSEYEFRVVAVNKAGESEPSSTTGRIKITEYPDGMKPEFVKKIKDLEAPIGGNVSFTVEFEGKPAPTVKW